MALFAGLQSRLLALLSLELQAIGFQLGDHQKQVLVHKRLLIHWV
jgi:hypothetical protein